MKRHGEPLWVCDFFSVKSVVTAKGIRDLYLLGYLCLQTREVIVTESTEHPTSAWVCRQGKWFAEQTKARAVNPVLLMQDLDVKFMATFTKALKKQGITTNPRPITSPNLHGMAAIRNAFQL